MKKLFKKTLFILLIIFVLMILFSNKIFAVDYLVDLIEDPSATTPEGKILEIANPILTLIQIISAGMALGLIIYDGIKLLTTIDNSEKANLKRKILYYIIGGVLIFAPATLIKYISQATTIIA